MRTFPISSLRLSAALALLLFFATSCKKDNPNMSIRDCQQSGRGINGTNGRDLVFWTRQDFGCGNPKFVEVRDTENGSIYFIELINNYITQQYPTQPTCDASGAIIVRVIYGYDYTYIIECNGRQWKGKVRVDCSSDDCVFVELK